MRRQRWSAVVRTRWPPRPGSPIASTRALVIAGVGPYDASDLDFLAGMGQQNIDEFGAARQGETELRHHLAPDLELRQPTPPASSTGLRRCCRRSTAPC